MSIALENFPQVRGDLRVQLITSSFTKAIYSLQSSLKLLSVCGHPEIRELENSDVHSGAARR
jgi:hypothetical protein